MSGEPSRDQAKTELWYEYHHAESDSDLVQHSDSWNQQRRLGAYYHRLGSPIVRGSRFFIARRKQPKVFSEPIVRPSANTADALIAMVKVGNGGKGIFLQPYASAKVEIPRIENDGKPESLAPNDAEVIEDCEWQGPQGRREKRDIHPVPEDYLLTAIVICRRTSATEIQLEFFPNEKDEGVLSLRFGGSDPIHFIYPNGERKTDLVFDLDFSVRGASFDGNSIRQLSSFRLTLPDIGNIATFDFSKAKFEVSDP